MQRRVALRKESVDRNISGLFVDGGVASASLSARRAWIEITPCRLKNPSADRRSPQGERG